MTDRLPPYSEEAEKAVLGSVLLDGLKIADICGEYQLETESFYIPSHQAVFDAMMTLRKQSKIIDIVSVRQLLQEHGKLDAVGGQGALEKFIDKTPTSTHAEYYIDIVAKKARLRAIIQECRETEDKCFGEQSDEVEEIIALHAGRLSAIENRNRQDEVPWSQIVKESMEEAEAVIKSNKSLIGLSTGFRNLDNGTLGLKPGEMTILAGRPSMGKTSLAMNIAEHVSLGRMDPDNKGRPVGIFSLEMSAKALAMRMKCSFSRVCYWEFLRRLKKGIPVQDTLSALVYAASVLRKAPIFCDDTGGLDIQQVRLRARRWKEKHGIKLIVLDYLQFLHDSQNARQGRQIEVSKISASLKECAKELNIPLLVLAQLSRKPEEKGRGGVPKLSDLRDSGSIEQDADNVWLLRRPCKCEGDDEEEDKGLAIIDVAKQRNGPTGDIRLNFLEEFTRFEDRTVGIDEDESGHEYPRED